MPPISATMVTYDWANKIDLSGTGSTANSTALEVGRWYTLFVGDNDVYIDGGATSPTATTSDVGPLAAKSQLSFQADNGSRFIALIHSDGSSAHVAFLVPSSPAV